MLDRLPAGIQHQAKSAYHLFRDNPQHPGLSFKKIRPTRPIYSIRIGREYRAVGILQDDIVVWYWIGSHADYDKLLSQF
jgi:hypothetical protein